MVLGTSCLTNLFKVSGGSALCTPFCSSTPFPNTVLQETHLVLSVLLLLLPAVWIYMATCLRKGERYESPLRQTLLTCPGLWLLLEEQQGLVPNKGQCGHLGGRKGRKHHVLSSLCPSGPGSGTGQRWLEAARARLFTSSASLEP